jgi:murein DD-endopeptidase MepM/ murein hydrolase activator NlpD
VRRAAAVLLGAGLAASASPPAPAAAAQQAPGGAIALYDAPRQGALVRGIAPAGTAELLLDGAPVPVAPDGRFIVGFDRDHAGAAMLAARLGDGTMVRSALAVASRSWRIERVNIARRPGGASEDYLRLRERELARIAAARAVDSGSTGWRQRFAWPARGRISGVFGSQRIYRGEPASFHSGVDVAGGAGAAVTAPADGVVVLAGPPAFSLEGNLVILDHGNGLNSAFLHLASVSVSEGQKVRRGAPIGTIGATGRATGPHLHWSLRWRDARIDPAVLAGPMP